MPEATEADSLIYSTIAIKWTTRKWLDISSSSLAPIERRRENSSTIVDDDDNFESIAETSTIENSRSTTRNEEYRSLSSNVLDEIQAYLSIDVTQRLLPPNTPGAFLHVGKAGGSTLCSVHPLSFHSFVLKQRYNLTQRRELLWRHHNLHPYSRFPQVGREVLSEV